MREREVVQKIIGGIFGLEILQATNCNDPRFLEGRNILLANARSGIWLLIQMLKPRVVWMPSYLVDVMLEAVDDSIAELRFYEMNYDLKVSSLDWLDDIQPGDLVVMIDYFGFPCESSIAVHAKENGAWVLEDAAQALLSSRVGQFSDFILFNPIKFLGVPDGGVLKINCDIDWEVNDLIAPPEKWWLNTFNASIFRREFDLYGGSRQWFDLFKKAETECPFGNYWMSEFSRMLLINNFDYMEISQKRVDNYQVLYEELGELALYPRLIEGVVPLGFPIRVRERDRVRQALFDQQIYPPIHWHIKDIVPNRFRESHKLSVEILTLICDQRYDRKDMYRIAQVVLETIN